MSKTTDLVIDKMNEEKEQPYEHPISVCCHVEMPMYPEYMICPECQEHTVADDE